MALMFGALTERASTGIGLVDTDDASREPTKRRKRILFAVWGGNQVKPRAEKKGDVTQENGNKPYLHDASAVVKDSRV